MPDHYVFRATNLPISYNKKTKALQDLLHKRFNDDKSDSAGRVNGTFELVKADDDDKEPYVTFVPTKLQLDGEAVTAIFGVPNPLHPFLEELIPGSNKQVVKEYSTRVLSPSGLRRAVSIDSSFHGFTQMYPTTDGVDIEADIIALHGLDGHPYGSWKSKGNLQHMWLRDSFVKHFPTCRTLIYGYDSNLKTRGHHSLSDFTVQLLDRLMSLRKTEEERRRPIIWIAHSFGGLLLRQALLVASEEFGVAAYDCLLKATHGMLLFGVPHRGIATVNQLSAALKKSGGNGRLALLEELKPRTDAQSRYHERFVNLISRYEYQVMSFIEKQESKQLVVKKDGTWERSGPAEEPLDPNSASFRLPNNIEQVFRVEADHSQLVKFEHEHDETYMKVVEFVGKLKRDAPEAVRKKFGVNTSPATTPSPEASPSRRRQRTTAEEANFTCTLCGMYFLRKGNYKQHLETHNPNREKPYKCTECPVSFVRNVDFVRHFSSIHEKIKPFVCSDCGAGFPRKDAMHRHMKSVCRRDVKKS